MHLKSFKITNFRKFRTSSNTIEFVNPKKNDGDLSYTASGATTLIVGRNNSGKTSIAAALEHAVNHRDPKGNNFNFDHLLDVLNKHKDAYNNQKAFCVEVPWMSFTISIDFSNGTQASSLQNITSFINVKHLENNVEAIINIELRYIVAEVALFAAETYKLIERFENHPSMLFREFVKMISNKVKFKQVFYCENEEVKPSRDFKLSDLIDVRVVTANLDNSQNSLSNVFNKIIKYKLRYDEENGNEGRENLDNKIFNINEDVTSEISAPHEKTVNAVVEQIVDSENMTVNLRSDLDFDSLFSNLIRYEFKEGNHFIPENQFGLGYSNLMKILGHIIDYVEQYEEADSEDKANIIFIEEPENFMHPQMQELFIKHIDKAVEAILGQGKKNINSQLVITTHSSHILNSKIHTSNTFSNINYLTRNEINQSTVVALTDAKIQGDGSKKDVNFLKKHIKFKVSDLFFSDAIIIVEGITEEHLIAHYIAENKKLNRKYISVFNINGAYAHIYEPLIKLLRVPCLIITDVDVKRTDDEKEQYQQLKSLEGRATTNSVLNKYWDKVCPSKTENSPNDLQQDTNEDEHKAKENTFEKEIHYGCNSNFYVVFQKDNVNGYYATSFEEAYILTNFANDILLSTLETVISKKAYKEIIGEDDVQKNLLDNSFRLQKKLSASKSNFANTLIYQMASQSADKWPLLPKYIKDGLLWLETELSINSPSGV